MMEREGDSDEILEDFKNEIRKEDKMPIIVWIISIEFRT